LNLKAAAGGRTTGRRATWKAFPAQDMKCDPVVCVPNMRSVSRGGSQAIKIHGDGEK
jgi:hypothetical protein